MTAQGKVIKLDSWPHEVEFDKELFSLRNQSQTKIQTIAKFAHKYNKYFKFIVRQVGAYVKRSTEQQRVPAVYVIDAIIRCSKSTYIDKDTYASRFADLIVGWFDKLSECSEDDRRKIARIVGVWKEKAVFSEEVLAQLEAKMQTPKPGLFDGDDPDVTPKEYNEGEASPVRSPKPSSAVAPSTPSSSSSSTPSSASSPPPPSTPAPSSPSVPAASSPAAATSSIQSISTIADSTIPIHSLLQNQQQQQDFLQQQLLQQQQQQLFMGVPPPPPPPRSLHPNMLMQTPSLPIPMPFIPLTSPPFPPSASFLPQAALPPFSPSGSAPGPPPFPPSFPTTVASQTIQAMDSAPPFNPFATEPSGDFRNNSHNRRSSSSQDELQAHEAGRNDREERGRKEGETRWGARDRSDSRDKSTKREEGRDRRENRDNSRESSSGSSRDSGRERDRDRDSGRDRDRDRERSRRDDRGFSRRDGENVRASKWSDAAEKPALPASPPRIGSPPREPYNDDSRFSASSASPHASATPAVSSSPSQEYEKQTSYNHEHQQQQYEQGSFSPPLHPTSAIVSSPSLPSFVPEGEEYDLSNLSSLSNDLLSVLGGLDTSQLEAIPEMDPSAPIQASPKEPEEEDQGTGSGEDDPRDKDLGMDEDSGSDDDEHRLEEARKRMELASERAAKEKEEAEKLKAGKRRAVRAPETQEPQEADLEHTDAQHVTRDVEEEEPPTKKNKITFTKHPGFIVPPDQEGVPEGVTKVLSTTLCIADVADLKTDERVDVRVKSLFNKFGPIELFTVVKGIGFLKFKERLSAEEALASMRGHQLENGAQLKLAWGRCKLFKEEDFDLQTGEAMVATADLPISSP